MNQLFKSIYIVTATIFISGCVTSASTSIKEIVVEIISEPPGANIEVSDDYIGKTPTTVSIPSNSKGEFTRTTTIQALPVIAGHCTQSKYFKGGYDYINNDIIPKRIFFDMRLCPVQ
jgi:hypothetical protein